MRRRAYWNFYVNTHSGPILLTYCSVRCAIYNDKAGQPVRPIRCVNLSGTVEPTRYHDRHRRDCAYYLRPEGISPIDSCEEIDWGLLVSVHDVVIRPGLFIDALAGHGPRVARGTGIARVSLVTGCPGVTRSASAARCTGVARVTRRPGITRVSLVTGCTGVTSRAGIAGVTRCAHVSCAARVPGVTGVTSCTRRPGWAW